MIVILAPLTQAFSTLPTDTTPLESSISALESAIKTLENSSVPWEHLVWLFTFLVVVGVAMELLVIRHEWRDDMEAWALAYFWAVRTPDRPSRAKLWVEIVSVLLITIGIIGELGVGIKIASINGSLRVKSAELRSKSDQLLALVTQQAGDASQSATTAHQEAGAVKGIADAARKDAEDALAKAQIAQRELARAESDASKAQSEASKVRQEVDATQKRVESVSANLELIEKYEEPRHLTKEQKERLKSLVSDRASDDHLRMVYDGF